MLFVQNNHGSLVGAFYLRFDYHILFLVFLFEVATFIQLGPFDIMVIQTDCLCASMFFVGL